MRCEKDEDRYEGFSGASGGEGQAEGLADAREEHVRLGGGVQAGSGEACQRLELAAGAAIRVEQVCAAAGISGDGCGGQGWRDQARHVGRESGGLRGGELQAAERGGTGARLSVAGGGEKGGAGGGGGGLHGGLRGGAGG